MTLVFDHDENTITFAGIYFNSHRYLVQLDVNTLYNPVVVSLIGGYYSFSRLEVREKSGMAASDPKPDFVFDDRRVHLSLLQEAQVSKKYVPYLYDPNMHYCLSLMLKAHINSSIGEWF